jgi:hypothetical protein
MYFHRATRYVNKYFAEGARVESSDNYMYSVMIRPIKINNLFYMGVRLDFRRRLDFFL